MKDMLDLRQYFAAFRPIICMENDEHLKNVGVVNTLPLSGKKHFLSCKYFF